MYGVDLIFARDEVLFLGIDEAHDWVIPGGFFEFFENFHVFAADVIVDRNWDEVLLDHSDEWLVREDFGPEDLAASSSRNLLEEEKDGLLMSGGLFERSFEVSAPVY